MSKEATPKTMRFNALAEKHQQAIATRFTELIMAKKPDVIKRIFNISNPQLVLVFEGDYVKTFHLANDESKKVFSIALNTYLNEAL